PQPVSCCLVLHRRDRHLHFGRARPAAKSQGIYPRDDFVEAPELAVVIADFTQSNGDGAGFVVGIESQPHLADRLHVVADSSRALDRAAPRAIDSDGAELAAGRAARAELPLMPANSRRKIQNALL